MAINITTSNLLPVRRDGQISSIIVNVGSGGGTSGGGVSYSGGTGIVVTGTTIKIDDTYFDGCYIQQGASVACAASATNANNASCLGGHLDSYFATAVHNHTNLKYNNVDVKVVATATGGTICGDLCVLGNIRAVGDVMAFASENAPINWWNNLPSEINSIIGSGITVCNGLLYVTGGSGGISCYCELIGIPSTFTPSSHSNSSHSETYITGINNTMVTTALGYTPYNSSNPSGYITSSATVANSLALCGCTPACFLGAGGTATNSALIGGWGESSLAKKYNATINLSTTYAKIARIQGGGLGSVVKITMVGTGGNVVVSMEADIIVNHYKDIFIKSIAGAYTTVTLKITSDANADYYIEAKINSANVSPIRCYVYTYGDETVTMSPASVTGTEVFEHIVNIHRLTISNYDGDGNTVGGITINGSIKGEQVYTGGWFRNWGTTGLYNETYTNYLYAGSAGEWNMAAGSGYPNLTFRSGFQSTIRGLVYSDGSGFGLLNNVAGWGVRLNDGTGYGGSLYGTWNVTGNLNVNGEVTAYYSSDERLKQNIKPIKSALSTICKLQPVQYNWNCKAVELNESKDTCSNNYGLIAQQLECVMPELVHSIYDSEYKSIDYVQLVPVLIQGIKELQQQICYLKTDLNYFINNK